MTIQGAIAELQNLLKADDVPFYYKGVIEKVIETIQMDIPKQAEQTEPQTEHKCINCKFLIYKFGKTWCDIKCDNPHDEVCDRWKQQTDCAWK